jgi:competence protein ComEC
MVAVGLTLGLVLDRYAAISLPLVVLGLLAGLAGLARAVQLRRDPPVIYPVLAALAVGAAYHHAWQNLYPPDEIGWLVGDEAVLVRLRGQLVDEPYTTSRPRDEQLLSIPRDDTTAAVVQVSALASDGDWRAVSGRVRLTWPGEARQLMAGDVIEATGMLAAPARPANPGEADYAQMLRDRRIRAEVQVAQANALVRLEAGRLSNLGAALAWGRRQGAAVLRDHLPDRQAAIAEALLLGRTSALSREEWDAFVRTGVVHVLAISGQHLGVLAGLLWLLLRLGGTERRLGATIVAAVLLAYTLLVGARPPVLRAACMGWAVGAALWLRRPVLPLNILALAWLVVVAVCPSDPFTLGCQLSFLTMVVILQLGPLLTRPPDPPDDPLARLNRLGESWLSRCGRWLGQAVLASYALNAIICVSIAPLTAYSNNLIALAALIIGPPVVVVSSVALVAGFFLLMVGAAVPDLAWPLARLTEWCLGGCEAIVHAVVLVPGAWVEVPTPPSWWVVGAYALIGPLLVWPRLLRRGRGLMVALAAWLALAPWAMLWRGASSDELRVCFLAVGHGACTVLELPDGRVMLYDVGSLRGPEVARRVVVPYLHHRGIRCIDEVFLSHADLDHFNGLLAVHQHVRIAQLTVTPTFGQRQTPGVARVLEVIERAAIPVRQAVAGDRFRAGAVVIEVLHPPADGAALSSENARSLLLHVRHSGHHILLTGDLEKDGLARVLEQPAPPVDILAAPHHGSRLANPPALAAWAKPRFVAVSEGRRPTLGRELEAFTQQRIPVRSTFADGAITVRSHRSGLSVQMHRTGEQLALPNRAEPP